MRSALSQAIIEAEQINDIMPIPDAIANSDYESEERAFNRRQFWRRFGNWAFWICVVCIFVAPFLVGCAEQPYWFKDGTPTYVGKTQYVDNIYEHCHRMPYPVYGCAVRNDFYGTIFIQKGLPSDLTKCAQTHERRHLERGETHIIRPTFVVDCGDGTYWQPPYPGRFGQL